MKKLIFTLLILSLYNCGGPDGGSPNDLKAATELKWLDFESEEIGIVSKILLSKRAGFDSARDYCGTLGEQWGLPGLEDFGPARGPDGDAKTREFVRALPPGILYDHSPGPYEMHVFWSQYEASETTALAIFYASVLRKVRGLSGDKIHKTRELNVVCVKH